MALSYAKDQLLSQALLGYNNFSSDGTLQVNKDNSPAPISNFDVMNALYLSKKPRKSQDELIPDE